MTYAFFCYRSGDSRTLHFTLGVDDDTSIVLWRKSSNRVLKNKGTSRRTSKYRKTPSLRRHAFRWRTTTAGIAKRNIPISTNFEQNPARRTLLPQLRLSLLHRRNNHVANTSIWQPVQASTEAERFDDVERLGAAVVSAVENCTNGQTESQSVLGSRCTTGWLWRSLGVHWTAISTNDGWMEIGAHIVSIWTAQNGERTHAWTFFQRRGDEEITAHNQHNQSSRFAAARPSVYCTVLSGISER